MDTSMPGMDPDMGSPMPEKKKFPTWIIVVLSVLGTAVLLSMVGYVFLVNYRMSTTPPTTVQEVQFSPGQQQALLDEVKEMSPEEKVFERGEDSFGQFVRASETAPKDYSGMFAEDPIVVEWLSHASVVSNTKAEEIYKDIYPQYFLDKEALSAEAKNVYDEKTKQTYAFHLYQLGTISAPEKLKGMPVYMFSYPVGGMGISVWGEVVIYAENIHGFLSLDATDIPRLWGFPAEIVDVNKYIKGSIYFDKGLTFPNKIAIPDSNDLLVNTGELVEKDSNPFESYGAPGNAGGILNLVTEQIITGYPKDAIEFFDEKDKKDVYYLDGAYQIFLDDGSVQTYEVFPSFLEPLLDDGGNMSIDYYYGYTADVNWNKDFSQSKNTYVLGGSLRVSGCAAGVIRHTNIVDAEPWFVASDLTQVGTAANGDGVYVMAHPEDVQIYKDLFDFGGQAAFMQAHPDLDFAEFEKVPEAERYKEFLDNDPIIFWKDHKDRWRIYFKSEYRSLAECGKPVIYLYPEEEMDVNVKVAPNGGFTYTDPEYPESGWFVHATPEGKLYSYRDLASYPYLFWEGHADGFGFSDKGFVFSRDTLESDMTNVLAKAGLNKQETADFLEFWLPKMEEKPYVFVTFANQRAFESAAPLTITPRPDSVLRIFMYFEPLDSYKKVEPLRLSGFERKGFTVVEWGGVLEKK